MAEHQLPKLMSAVFDHSLAGCFSLGKRGSAWSSHVCQSSFYVQPVTLVSGVSLVLTLR
jgi:hypothetical protein